MASARDFPEDAPAGKDETIDEALLFGNPTTRRKFLATSASLGAGITLGTIFIADGMDTLAAAESTTPQPNPETRVMIGATLKINGQVHELKLDPRTTLLDVLRDRLQLPGTKKGCDHGQCGACTVLQNGRRINSCLVLALTCEGDEITTIEGLAKGETLHPMQAAFIKHDGFQCGYCTPGQICSAVACVAEGHATSDNQIREFMSGNICRCGAYPNILAAIREVQGQSTTLKPV